MNLSKSFRRDNIAYVVRKANDKLGELLHILSSLKASAIVYVRKRAGAEELARFLKAKGIFVTLAVCRIMNQPTHFSRRLAIHCRSD